ncbi:bicyclomycin resistance protein [Ideonella sp. B7]|uniref:ABC transporter substrate-binding protein n=1 Tax=Ideonella benzenivorans TaxID=2831643 RepID=UPI001CEC9727|nr:ABC transporter substrate-binding protein [Ideonella benzenivorans]MCA6218148.1 bicyclomycin resistance protein [Ideonella benzenivorans]
MTDSASCPLAADSPTSPARRQGLKTAGLAGAAALIGPGPLQAATDGASARPKVLRYALKVAETGFDPAKVSDLYSHLIIANILEGLYEYDHLARPAKIRPCTAVALPEVSGDYRVFTVRLRPGIYFSSDPAFKGRRRELVAEDYVYALKRHADPANKSPIWGDYEELDFIGLNALREEALKSHRPFDYDRVVPGVRALDRYTLRFELSQSRPRLIETLASGDTLGAVAREVVEFYGPEIMGHPVGTGPFKLVQWRRSSLIALERNPDYRVRTYDAQPAADDAEGQALLARFKGRRLPMLDRVEVSIIEENQPRWLSFLNGEHNLLERLPEDFASLAIPGGHLAPNLSKQGLRAYRSLVSDIVLTCYNMEDPVVGGNSPERVALRRAMNLALDIPREIDLVRRGQGIPAQALIVPNTSGYDPRFRSEMGQYDPARARALLDIHGYIDRNGDGWREQPNGQPLKLVKRTQPDGQSRQLDELWQRNMNAIGIQIEFLTAKWPENLKACQAGNYQIWGVGSSATAPDGQGALGRMYGPLKGSANLARFQHAEFDAIYRQLLVLPDGPEREALFARAKRIGIAYAPYKCHLHRYVTDITHPEVLGYRRGVFWQNWWQYIDIDPTFAREA